MPAGTAKSYYDILGVSENASKDEIKKAYLKLAQKHHPDKTQGDKASEEKLKEINQAWATLKDPEKRSEYDQMRARGAMGGMHFGAGPGAGGPGAAGAEAGAGGFSFHTSFEDLFGDLFGGGAGPRQRGPRPGHDLETVVTVSLQEAAEGAQRQIRVGEGQGKTVKVSIPPGAETGTRLRLSGQGASGEQGAPPGDLYVVVKVQPDTRFEREGGNLRRDQTISFAKAALGGKERVPTLAGNVNLTIPPGTQSGRVFRLKGQGMPRLNGRGKGDLLVRVEVKVPQNLSDEQKELIRRLDELDHSG